VKGNYKPIQACPLGAFLLQVYTICLCYCLCTCYI